VRAADRAFLDEFYWAAFSRPASPDQLDAAQRHIDQLASRDEGLADLCWAVLNSKEFLFQH
jgi:hypothetical protein